MKPECPQHILRLSVVNHYKLHFHFPSYLKAHSLLSRKCSIQWKRAKCMSLWFSLMTSLLNQKKPWHIGVFLKWNRNSLNSVNSEKLINHWCMKWAQFKDPVSHMCLAGAVVACWFMTQEVSGSNTHFFAKIFFKFYRFCRFYSIQ